MMRKIDGMIWLTKEMGKTIYLRAEIVPERKKADIMTRGEIWKDFFKKIIMVKINLQQQILVM